MNISPKMTRPLLAILLLTTTALSSPAIAATEEHVDWLFDQVYSGELDGKAIICNAIEEVIGVRHKGIEFKSGGVVEYWVRTEGTSAILHQEDEGSRYTVSTKTIQWGFWTLNRETLALQYRWPDVNFNYQCELADSPEALLKSIEAARLETQRKIDEEMSNNKI